MFQQLVDIIDRNTDCVELAVLVACLSRCTASLHKKRHSDLTSIVLKRCFRADENLTAAIENFAVNCVSVNADLLAAILHELVKHFSEFDLLATQKPETIVDCGGAAHGVHESEEARQEAQNARDVHRVVHRVLETFPTGTMCFLDQLVQLYPHRVRRAAEQRAYLSNILHVTTYQPQLLPEILENVVERLIKIDVEVDPQKLEALNRGAIDVTDDDELFGIELEETAEDRRKMQENVEKLDSMMLILCQFFHTVLGGRELPRERKDIVFKSLLATFNSKILTTFRSKYSQFLIFYACHFQVRHARVLRRVLCQSVVPPVY